MFELYRSMVRSQNPSLHERRHPMHSGHRLMSRYFGPQHDDGLMHITQFSQ